MRSFISFQPGEQRSCVGCHETRAEASPSSRTASALLREPVKLTPPPWGDRPISFLRDIQPIFDRHCVDCHGGLKPAGGLDFAGGLTTHQYCCMPSEGVPGYGANRCFDTLLAHQLVACSPALDGDAAISEPMAFGSHKSKIVAVLRDGACSKRATLSEAEWRRLVTWIDANAPYHDGFVNKRPKQMPYDLPRDAALQGEITAVHSRRCAGCHAPENVSHSGWIDIRQPEDSLFLTAPLAKTDGGTGACRTAVYENTDDEDYAHLLKLVTAAVARTWAEPRRDIATLDRP